MHWRHRIYDWQYASRRALQDGLLALLSWWTPAVLLLVTFLVGAALWLDSQVDEQPIPDLAALRAGAGSALGQTTIVYTADGKELTRYYRENRTWVGTNEMAAILVDALVATEDHRFYSHRGVDWLRLGTSVVKTLQGDRQGGSTITMQLTRNYDSGLRDLSAYRRKLQEILTAPKLEAAYTKDEIVELYLNTVPFGFDAFGVDAAARTYFGKPAAAVDTLEAATLVGMLKATTRYNPLLNPEAARQRRNVVLGQMAKHGLLTPTALSRLQAKPLDARLHRTSVAASRAPYFAEFVRTWLDAWAARNGYDPYTDGLRVYTTLDSRIQAFAQAAVDEQLEDLQAVAGYEWSRPDVALLSQHTAPYQTQREAGHFEPFAHLFRRLPAVRDDAIRRSARYQAARRQGQSDDDALARLRDDADFLDSLRAVVGRLETGFLALEPKTGAIRAWIGGRDFLKDQYDHVALAKRQPGSTFKPIVYAAALDRGWSPDDAVVDAVRTYRVNGTSQQWTPRNVGGATGDTITVRQGLMLSKNTVTAQLMAEIGPEYVAFLARRMGIQSALDEVPALALGTSDVTLLELAAAYTPFVNEGVYRKPLVVTHIDDQAGQRLATFSAPSHMALPRYTAYEVLDMLQDVVDRGTGVRIRSQFGRSGDLAGKTGTTQNSADGWFILMHPELIMGAWVGFNDRRVAFRSSYWGQGAHNALFVVGDFLQRAQEGGFYSPSAVFRGPSGGRPAVPLVAEPPPGDRTASPDRQDAFLQDAAEQDAERALRTALQADQDTLEQPQPVPRSAASSVPRRSEEDAEASLRRMLRVPPDSTES